MRSTLSLRTSTLTIRIPLSLLRHPTNSISQMHISGSSKEDMMPTSTSRPAMRPMSTANQANITTLQTSSFMFLMKEFRHGRFSTETIRSLQTSMMRQSKSLRQTELLKSSPMSISERTFSSMYLRATRRAISFDKHQSITYDR